MARRTNRSQKDAGTVVSRRTGPLRVLVVDGDPRSSDQLSEVVDRGRFDVVHAGTLGDARAHLDRQQVDLALIDDQLPDGSGATLADELGGLGSETQTIMICSHATFAAATRAVRSGAADVLLKPLKNRELAERVQEAAARHEWRRREQRRVRRLRRTCRRLGQLRSEVTDQVDVLCKDLVTAYQELAEQMQRTIQATEFSAVVRKELDIGQLLRKTLEFILNTAGPTNAAIFLPASDGRYTVGGYINNDCAGESMDMLLDHLADVLACRVAKMDEPLHITTNPALSEVLGDDSAYLIDSHLLGYACCHENEVLAVVVLFRDQSQPYEQAATDLAVTMGPILGDYMAKLIRIHHRHLDNPEEDSWDVSG